MPTEDLGDQFFVDFMPTEDLGEWWPILADFMLYAYHYQ